MKRSEADRIIRAAALDYAATELTYEYDMFAFADDVYKFISTASAELTEAIKTIAGENSDV